MTSETTTLDPSGATPLQPGSTTDASGPSRSPPASTQNPPPSEPREQEPSEQEPSEAPSEATEAPDTTGATDATDSETAITEKLNDDDTSDFMFRKKNVKPRTQSFQSVLSTASLKSLNQPIRNSNSVSTNQGLTHSHNNSTKNFQSFIQAPVLSSITNLKNADDIEIGRQLPFVHDNNEAPSHTNSRTHSIGNIAATKNQEFPDADNGDDQYDDQDTILQQQKLTLNALKKLSLSPLPRIEHDQNSSIDSEALKLKPKTSKSSLKKSEPYQPAEVDLSTFASLTRQPNHNLRSLNSDNSPSKANSSDSNRLDSNESPESYKNSRPMSQSQATQRYHNEVYQLHQQSQPHSQPQPTSQPTSQPANQSVQSIPSNLKVQTNLPKNTLLSDLNLRRRSNNLSPLTLMNRIPSPSQSVPAKQLAPAQVQTQPQNIQQQQNLPPTSASSSVPGTQRPSLAHTQSQGQESYFKLQQPQPQAQPMSQSYSQLSQTNKKHLQQIKGLRSPMYIPAVLRMTMDLNNTNTNKEDDRYDSYNGSSATSVKSFDSNLSTDSISSAPILSNKTYEHFLRQLPTKKHWVKDELVYKCSKTSCDKEFNFFERRHHCRKCGRIYCKEHTSHYLYINHLAQFTTGGRGTLSKVCDSCIEEYNEFMKSEFGVNVNHQGQLATERLTMNSAPPTKPVHPHKPAPLNNDPRMVDNSDPQDKPLVNKHINKPHLDSAPDSEQVVGSVPANWSWSSF